MYCHKSVKFSLKPISDFRGVGNGTAYVHAPDSCPNKRTTNWKYYSSALKGWAEAGEDLAVECIGRHGVINYNK